MSLQIVLPNDVAALGLLRQHEVLPTKMGFFKKVVLSRQSYAKTECKSDKQSLNILKVLQKGMSARNFCTSKIYFSLTYLSQANTIRS